MTPVPEPLARVAALMSTFRPQWPLCGGSAAPAWLGRQTRDHADIDVAVFQDDQHAIFDHLAGSQMIGHDNNVADDSSEPWDGRRLDLPAPIPPPHDELDFLALLPHLAEKQRYWLREAISLVHPGHPWLTQLSL